MGSQRGLRGLRRVGQALAVAFVGWTAWRVSQDWTGLPPGVDWGRAALAAALLVAANFVLSAAWIQLVERLSGQKLPLRWLVRVFLASNLGRYLPGKVGLPAIRIAALRGRGLGAGLVGASMLLEVLSWLIAGGALAAAVVSLAPPPSLSPELLARLGVAPRWAAAGLAGLAGLAGVALLVDRARLPTSAVRALGLAGQGPLTGPGVPLIHVVYWLCWLGHGWLLLSGAGAQATGLAAAFLVAPVAGFLAFVAPAGAGVREAILIAWIAPAAGMPTAVSVSLVSRALSLVADVVAWLFSVWLAPNKPQAATASPPSSSHRSA